MAPAASEDDEALVAAFVAASRALVAVAARRLADPGEDITLLGNCSARPRSSVPQRFLCRLHITDVELQRHSAQVRLTSDRDMPVPMPTLSRP